MHYHNGSQIQKLLLPTGQGIRRLIKPVLDSKIRCHFCDTDTDHILRHTDTFQPKSQFMPDLICYDLCIRILKNNPNFLYNLKNGLFI